MLSLVSSHFLRCRFISHALVVAHRSLKQFAGCLLCLLLLGHRQFTVRQPLARPQYLLGPHLLYLPKQAPAVIQTLRSWNQRLPNFKRPFKTLCCRRIQLHPSSPLGPLLQSFRFCIFALHILLLVRKKKTILHE